MRDPRIQVRGQVRIDLLPVVPVIAYFFAVTTDRKKPSKLLHLGKCLFGLPGPLNQSSLQVQDSASLSNSRTEFRPVEWLCHVIVCAAVQTLHDILRSSPGCQQD